MQNEPKAASGLLHKALAALGSVADMKPVFLAQSPQKHTCPSSEILRQEAA